MLEGKKVAKTENLKSALCGISEFEENEKKCVCLSLQLFAISSVVILHIHNLQTITPQSFNHTTFKPSYHNHTKITQS